MSFTTGVNIKNISIQSEKDVTVEDIISEAIAINRKLQAKKLTPGDMDAADAFLAEMRREHKQFADAYPIVLRYMCQMQQFHAAAFRKYLSYIALHPWKGADEYMDSQTHYVVLLYKQTHARWNKTQVENLRKNVRKLLQTEHDKFTELGEKYKNEVEHEETAYKKSREEELLGFYKKYGAEIDDLHIRAVSNVTTENIVNVDDLPTEEAPVIDISADDLLM